MPKFVEFHESKGGSVLVNRDEVRCILAAFQCTVLFFAGSERYVEVVESPDEARRMLEANG